MTVRRIALIALLGVGGALGFGVIANACLDMMWASAGRAVVTPTTMALASASTRPAELEPAPEGLVGTTDIRPVKVKTIQMVLANPDPAIPASALPYAASSATAPIAPNGATPPRPRPTPHEVTASVARPGAAKPARAAPAEDAEDLVLSSGQIDRIKTALALTPDQEALWPPVATELRAIAKQQPKRTATKGRPPKLTVDPDSAQRLYTAAAPLIMRLREDQKHTARQLALMLGLQEVAEAL
jgi:hypothetical protein